MNGESTRRRPRGPGGDDLVMILLAAVDDLSAAGGDEAACRLAGRACAVLRHSDLDGWKKFNAFLHRATRRLSGGEKMQAEARP